MKINKKRLFAKCLEEGLQKVVEMAILCLVMGIGFKALAFAVPAVMAGSVYSQLYVNFAGKIIGGR
jgi:hypothetical protein